MKNQVIIEVFYPIYIDGEKTKYILGDKGTCINTKTNKEKQSILRNNNTRRELTLSHKGKLYSKHLARWIALTFLELPDGDIRNYDADYIDGDPLNDTLENIQWLLKKDNKKKSLYVENKIFIGEKNGNATISEKTVRNIIELFLKGLTCVEIDNKLCLKRGISNSIISGRNWKHVSKDYNLENIYIKKPSPTFYDNEFKNRIHELLEINPNYTPREISKFMGIEYNNKIKCLVNRIKKQI